MAATVNTMEFMGRDGQPFSISSYNAADGAVGTYLPCDQNQVAVSTSPLDFVMPKDGFMTDFIAGAATGTIEIISNGDAKNIFIDYATRQASNAGRPQMKIPIRKGSLIRLKVVGVLPA